MHVFVSYSRADSKFVEDFSVIMAAHGIRCWVDVSNLTHGTPEWDQAIRAAITNSTWVIALCSEDSRDSNYVAIELAIASGLGKKIYPAWISGKVWSQSAPMSLILSQHVDVRPECGSSGILNLISNQQNEIAALEARKSDQRHPGWPWVAVKYNNSSTFINPFAFETNGHFLTEVYASLLATEFPPNTYGEKWAIGVNPPIEGAGFPHQSPHELTVAYLPAAWAKAPCSNVIKIDKSWYFRQPALWAGLLAPPALGRPRRRRPSDIELDEPAFRVVDLGKAKSLSSEYLGIRASCNSLHLIARGGHPKAIFASLLDRSEEIEQAFQRRGLQDARNERVLLGDFDTLHYIEDASRTRWSRSDEKKDKIVELH